jgi:Zn-dependent protease with chaperone function
MNTSAALPKLAAQWFDGDHAAPQTVHVWIDGHELSLQGAETDTAPQAFALRRVQWPEAWAGTQAHILLPGGSVLSCNDTEAYRHWLAASQRPPGLLARWQASSLLAALTTLLLAGLVWALWTQGIPRLADLSARWLPRDLDYSLGHTVERQLDASVFKYSKLRSHERNAVMLALQRAVTAAYNNRSLPESHPFRLEFRDGGKLVGANAFALPNDVIIVTDQLVELLADRPDLMVGVIGHEVGHLHHRHGLRTTLRASASGFLAGVLFGDMSFVLAQAPVLLAQAGYSRDFEREADAYARSLMRGAGLQPGEMAVLFERLAEAHRTEGDDDGPNVFKAAFASHPADAERIAFFKQ